MTQPGRDQPSRTLANQRQAPTYRTAPLPSWQRGRETGGRASTTAMPPAPDARSTTHSHMQRTGVRLCQPTSARNARQARYCSVQARCRRVATSRTCVWKVTRRSRGQWRGRGSQAATNRVWQSLWWVSSLLQRAASREQVQPVHPGSRTCACCSASWTMLRVPLRCAATSVCSEQGGTAGQRLVGDGRLGELSCSFPVQPTCVLPYLELPAKPPSQHECAPAGAAPRAALPQPQGPPAWCSAASPAGRRQSADREQRRMARWPPNHLAHFSFPQGASG